MVFYLIIGMIMAIYGGMNYYIGFWFWKRLGPKLPFLSGKVYCIIFTAVVITSLIGVIWNHYLPHFLQDGFYLAASYWLAAVAYFTIFILIIDMIRLLDRWLGFIPLAIKHKPMVSFVAGLLVFVTVGVLFVYGTLNARALTVTPYSINIAKQAGSLKQLRVALLSDIHLSGLEDKSMENLVDTINKMNPDIVLISGDIIDANRDTEPYELRVMEYNFQKIKSKYGIYASLGNHDYDEKGDSSYRIDRFKQAGVNVLRDSSVKIDNSFYLIGREDKFYERISGQKRKNLSIPMEKMDMKLPVIVLDHQPIDLEESRVAGVDLQLSGHTHKGQLFPFNFITSKIFQIDYGYLNIGNLQVVVSSGAGTWGPPIRIGSNSEIVDITLHFK